MASSKRILTLTLIALVALAFGGCSSDNNPAAVAVDTAPPAVPFGLNVAYAGGAATLSWVPNNVDSDLAGYVVIREHYGVSESLLDAPTLVTSFVDSHPLLGTSQYHIYAVDTAGNQSAIATVDLTIQQVHAVRRMS